MLAFMQIRPRPTRRQYEIYCELYLHSPFELYLQRPTGSALAAP